MNEAAPEQPGLIRDPSVLLDQLVRYCAWANAPTAPVAARKAVTELLGTYGLLDAAAGTADMGAIMNTLRGEAQHWALPESYRATMDDDSVAQLMARYNQQPVDLSHSEWEYSSEELAAVRPDLAQIADAAGLSAAGLVYRAEEADKAMRIMTTPEGGRYVLAELPAGGPASADVAAHVARARDSLPIPDIRFADVPSGRFLLTAWVDGDIPTTPEEVAACRRASLAFQAVDVSADAHFDFQRDNWKLAPASPTPIYIDRDLLHDVVERGFVDQPSEQQLAAFQLNLDRTLPVPGPE